MERLSNLFFELSHEDRLTILAILSRAPKKLTQIASDMDSSSQEVYRHISRLVDSGLVTKNSDGDYMITPYGSQVMKLVPGYGFLLEHSEYFVTRDLSLIPETFSLRIGELSDSQLVNDVMITLFDIEQLLNDADEYFCATMNQMVMNLYKPMADAVDRGVEIKVMRPKGWKLSEDIAKRIGDELLGKVLKKIQEGKILQREPDIVPVFMAFNEKEVGALSFANLDGELDYLAFKSKDVRAHKWCKDLFDEIWENSPMGEVRVKVG